MASWNLVNIGSGNGLLPHGTKSLHEPMLTCQQQGPLALRGNVHLKTHDINLQVLFKIYPSPNIQWVNFISSCPEGQNWKSLFVSWYADMGRYIDVYLPIRKAWDQIEDVLQTHCKPIYDSLNGMVSSFQKAWLL